MRPDGSKHLLSRMPSPNDYTVGDGLNTAGIRWLRRVEGQDTTNGDGNDTDRNQYNVRIDHNFNSNHKASFSGTWERDSAMTAQAGISNWPGRVQRLGPPRATRDHGIGGLHTVADRRQRVPAGSAKRTGTIAGPPSGVPTRSVTRRGMRFRRTTASVLSGAGSGSRITSSRPSAAPPLAARRVPCSTTATR